MKKIIWPGIVSGLVMIVAGVIVGYVCGLIPVIKTDYEMSFFRQMNDPLMWVFVAYPFVLGIFLAWFWDKVKGNFHGSIAERGFSFGWAYFLIATIPGMIMTYSSFTISLWTVISWTVSGFITSVIGAMVLAKMNK
jgi:uncharacterized membrane protein YeaQ/YmgE (transglycosylase-associated protein family)